MTNKHNSSVWNSPAVLVPWRMNESVVSYWKENNSSTIWKQEIPAVQCVRLNKFRQKIPNPNTERNWIQCQIVGVTIIIFKQLTYDHNWHKRSKLRALKELNFKGSLLVKSNKSKKAIRLDLSLKFTDLHKLTKI